MKRSAEPTGGSRRRRPARLARALGVAGAVAALGAGAAAGQAVANERVLELVSSDRSEGRSVTRAIGLRDGDTAWYATSFSAPVAWFADRGPDGWKRQFSPAQEVGSDYTVIAATYDGRQVLESNPFQPNQNTDHITGYYLRERGQMRLIARGPRDLADRRRVASHVGWSAELSTVLFSVRSAVQDEWGLGGVPTSNADLYRWRDGALSSIDATPAERHPAGCELRLAASVLTVLAHQRPVTDDGRRAVVRSTVCGINDGQLYLVDGDRATAITGRIEHRGSTSFAGMARDGSEIAILTSERLDPDDTDTTNDLVVYRPADDSYVAVTNAVPDLIPHSVTVAPNGRAYLTATRSGNHELWTYHGGELEHVWTASTSFSFGATGTDVAFSDDGTVLVFRSTSRLTDDEVSPGHPQLYRFDLNVSDPARRVVCVTCVGGRGSSNVARVLHLSSYMDAFSIASADGSVIAYATDSAHDPRDSNGRQDVYVWENGVTTLVSSGTIDSDAEFAGVSGDGRSVFFMSYGPLVAFENDSYKKLFVARIGGLPPSSDRPADCGLTCQPAPSAPPLPPPLASTVGEHDANVSTDGRLTVRRIGAAALRRAARTGVLRVRARSEAAARLTFTLRARIGNRWRTIRTVRTAVADAGATTVGLRLTKAARRHLARRGALRVRIVVTSSAADGTQRVVATVRWARRRPVRRPAARSRAAGKAAANQQAAIPAVGGDRG